MSEVVMVLARHRGLAMVAEGGHLVGVITAGDLTRLAERTPDFLGLPASTAMSATPKSTTADALAAEVTGQMERLGIMAMPVVGEAGVPVGVVHLHDLMRAGAV